MKTSEEIARLTAQVGKAEDDLIEVLLALEKRLNRVGTARLAEVIIKVAEAATRASDRLGKLDDYDARKDGGITLSPASGGQGNQVT